MEEPKILYRGLMMGLEQGLSLEYCALYLLLFYYPLSFFVAVVMVTIYVLAITDQRCGCLTEGGVMAMVVWYCLVPRARNMSQLMGCTEQHGESRL